MNGTELKSPVVSQPPHCSSGTMLIFRRWVTQSLVPAHTGTGTHMWHWHDTTVPAHNTWLHWQLMSTQPSLHIGVIRTKLTHLTSASLTHHTGSWSGQQKNEGQYPHPTNNFTSMVKIFSLVPNNYTCCTLLPKWHKWHWNKVNQNKKQQREEDACQQKQSVCTWVISWLDCSA